MESLRFKNILNTISRTHIRDYHQPAHGRKCDLWPHPPFFSTLPEDSSSGFQVTALNFPLPTRPTCPLASAFPSWSAPFIYLSLKIHLFNEVFSRCLHGHTPGQVSVIHTDNEGLTKWWVHMSCRSSLYILSRRSYFWRLFLTWQEDIPIILVVTV